jgi:hypothetical protein
MVCYLSVGCYNRRRCRDQVVRTWISRQLQHLSAVADALAIGAVDRAQEMVAKKAA